LPALETRQRPHCQVPQAERIPRGKGMGLGDGQREGVHGDGEPVQFRIGIGHEIDEPGIQPAGSDGVELLQARCRLQLQLRVRLPLAEASDGIGNHAVPGRILGKPTRSVPVWPRAARAVASATA
jgi:hypothetical protein